MRWSPYSNTTMILCVIWKDEFTVTLKVTPEAKIQTLLARIDHPLRHHIPNPDLNNTVFSLEAYGPELDMNSTFASLFGPTAESVKMYIGYRPRRSGRAARITYGE